MKGMQNCQVKTTDIMKKNIVHNNSSTTIFLDNNSQIEYMHHQLL